MMNDATIDVLIPVYNCADTLKSAVESILNQSLQEFRVLLLEDGSTDSSLDICQQLVEEDARVMCLSDGENRGIVYRLNQGIKHSSAPYIARMDGDDMSFSDRFKLQIEYLTNNTEVVACSGSYECIDEKNKVFDSHKACNKIENLESIPAKPHFLLHPLLMMRRSVLIRIGGYRNIIHCEDVDLYHRLADHGKLHNLSETLGQYRLHPASVSVKSEGNRILQCLNSQLIPLYARLKVNGLIADYMPTQLAQDIEQFISTQKTTFEEVLKFVSEDSELINKHQKWLKLAFLAKILQESRFRKWSIDTVNLRFINKQILKAFLLPNKRNISFVHHAKLWYGQNTQQPPLGLKIVFTLDNARSSLIRLKVK